MTKLIRGKIIQHIPLKQYTSWRAGGQAKYFFQPQDINDLANFLTSSEIIKPVYYLGLGSNLLIRDGGFNGTIIATQGSGLSHIEQVEPTLVRIEAGVACAKAARFCARLNLRGAEFLAGIPGTIGGALAMNAGCFGGETWGLVEAVETLEHDGTLRKRKPNEYEIAYRHVGGQTLERQACFVAGYFRLDVGCKEESLKKIRTLLDCRALTQPTGEHSCGSVFRNPVHDHAARLIEACGLKGHRCGGAYISTKHANFIINEGQASASDIEQLIIHVEQTVREKQDVALIREVRIIGEH